MGSGQGRIPSVQDLRKTEDPFKNPGVAAVPGVGREYQRQGCSMLPSRFQTAQLAGDMLL